MRFFKKLPVLKVILIVWIIFASVYVVYGEYNRLNVFVAQNAYNRGIQDSVVQLMTEAAKCQPIPIKAAGQSINLIDLNCLNTSDAGDAETVDLVVE